MTNLTAKIKKDHKVYRHTSTIHIKDTLTLQARKAYNFLLKNAYADLMSKDMHTIPLKELKFAMGLDSNDKYYKNNNFIRDTLRSLSRTSVDMNIFNKDKQNEWRTMSLLSEVRVSNGVCKYWFPESIRETLKNPNIYAKLDLMVLREIKSRNTLILWEYLVDILCKGYEATKWIKIEEFKNLFGFTDKSAYREFKIFKRDIINKAIKEVNGLNIKVEVEYLKEGRTVSHIKFNVSRASFQQSLPFFSVEGSEVNVDNVYSSALISSLKEDIGVSDNAITTLAKSYPEKKVQTNLKLVLDKIRKGKIDDKISYFFKALQEDYASNYNVDIVSNDNKQNTVISSLVAKVKKQEEVISVAEKNFLQFVKEHSEKIFDNYTNDKKENIMLDIKKEYFQFGGFKPDVGTVKIMVISKIGESLSQSTRQKLRKNFEKEQKFSFEDENNKLQKMEHNLSSLQTKIAS